MNAGKNIVKQEQIIALPTEYGEFTLYLYRALLTGENYLALAKGKIDDQEPVLVRLHSECLTGDIFSSRRCDCGSQLHEAMKRIQQEGRGILLYLPQEGRGIGLAAKIHAYKLQESGLDTVQANEQLGYRADLREYNTSASILQDLGVKRIRLMSNNPHKVAALEANNLKVVEQVLIRSRSNKHNRRYLETKRTKMGHTFLNAKQNRVSILSWIRYAPQKFSFPLAFIVLCASIVGALFLRGPLVWTSGILYIIYDTWLLALVAWKTSRLLKKGTPELHSASGKTKRPSLAVLITGRNEESVILNCLTALEKQSDAPDEIYFVDDGSTDASVEIVSKKYGVSTKLPQLKIWKKPHSGKARSLNEVWPQVKSDVIVTIDADTILEAQAIAFIRQSFGEKENLWAAGGVLTPTCRASTFSRIFENFQQFEYVRAFLARLAWMEMNSLLLVSGAFAAYRREALQEVGGYNPHSLVEDYDLIHQIHRYAAEQDKKILVGVIAGARAVTDAPSGFKSFLKQRERWFGGFLQTLFQNRDMIGNPSYSAVGKFMLPVKTFDTLQPLYGIVAFILLVKFILFDRYINPIILLIIGAKLVLDLIFHFWSLYLYFKWQSEKITPLKWIKAALATFFEPATFQLLRHIGALRGWIVFLSGKHDWAAQRPVNHAAVATIEENSKKVA